MTRFYNVVTSVLDGFHPSLRVRMGVVLESRLDAYFLVSIGDSGVKVLTGERGQVITIIPR